MSIKLKGSTAGSAVILAAPADTSPTGTEKTFTLPTQDGTAGQVLTTDGNANLSFATDSDTILESNRNLIINGAQQVDQRFSGSTAIGTLTNGKYITDRWNVRGQDNTTGQASQSTNAPAGFVNSLLIEVGGTAGATSAGGNRFIRQNIEGYVLRPLRWGTAGAKAATMSFWIRSSVTGTYSFAFFSGALNQHYATSYTINTANTWEYKTITVPGPTSGTFYTENQLALYCQWDLGSGSNFATSTLNQWASGDKRFASGSVDFFNNANANLRITGVQFEAGETATQFEHRSFADELHTCKRYYEHSHSYYEQNWKTKDWSYADGVVVMANSNGYSDFHPRFKVEKRANPSITIYSATGIAGNAAWEHAGVQNDTNYTGNQAPSAITTKQFLVRGQVGANRYLYCNWEALAEL